MFSCSGAHADGGRARATNVYCSRRVCCASHVTVLLPQSSLNGYLSSSRSTRICEVCHKGFVSIQLRSGHIVTRHTSHVTRHTSHVTRTSLSSNASSPHKGSFTTEQSTLHHTKSRATHTSRLQLHTPCPPPPLPHLMLTISSAPFMTPQ